MKVGVNRQLILFTENISILANSGEETIYTSYPRGKVLGRMHKRSTEPEQRRWYTDP